MRLLMLAPGGSDFPGGRPPGDPLDDLALAELYTYPREHWLRANMVSSADGAGFLDGRSEGLSSDDDRRLFGVLRVLADVVLVGAGTARTENYKPARHRPALAGLRAGRTATPPIALVSRTLDLDLESPLFIQAPADARTIVLTCAASPAPLRAAAARVADVIVAGTAAVDLTEAVGALNGRGLGRVLCEGGPHLLAQVAAAGLLDELCLTVSPLLAGPGPHRITEGAPFPALPMTLAHVLAADGFLFCRYVRQSASGKPANCLACGGAAGRVQRRRDRPAARRGTPPRAAGGEALMAAARAARADDRYKWVALAQHDRGHLHGLARRLDRDHRAARHVRPGAGLLSGPFHSGLIVVFGVSAALSVLAGLASLLRGSRGAGRVSRATYGTVSRV